MKAPIVSGIPRPQIALAVPAEAGANEPVLRSSDNTKCGNRFHDLQDDSMEDR